MKYTHLPNEDNPGYKREFKERRHSLLQRGQVSTGSDSAGWKYGLRTATDNQESVSDLAHWSKTREEADV